MNNYPPGAEHDPNAPYNQSEPEELEVDVQATYILSRIAPISTADYAIDEWDEWEDDGDGPVHVGGTEIDFSDTDFEDKYEHQYLSPIRLIEELKNRVEKEMAEQHLERAEYLHDLDILASCKDWYTEESEFSKA